MKTSFYTRLICCWLALVVLLSSTGFGMVDHWCQMRGHTKSLLLTRDGCATSCQSDEVSNPPKTGHSVRKMPCCKTQLSYEHLDVSRFIADYHSPAVPQPAGFIPNPEFRFLLVALQPADVLPVTLLPADDPLSRSGRFQLTSFCTWLI